MPGKLDIVLSELRQLDWVARHDCYDRLYRRSPRFAAGVAACMGADELLYGFSRPCSNEVKIALPGKVKRQLTIEEAFFRAKFAKN